MKKLIPFFAIPTLLFLMIGCQEDMTTRSLKGVYEIAVPNDMKSTTGLNPDASLQYENIYNETYLAIIEEDKQAFETAYSKYGRIDSTKSVISNYAKIQVDYLSKTLKFIEKKEPRQLSINGMNAEQIEFTASVEGVDPEIFYLMTFVEGNKNVYMIMTWTFDRFKNDYRSTFISMANSFREL